MVIKLCRDVPGIEAKLRSGELNLTTVSQLQNAIEKRARKATQERVSEVVTAPPIGAGIAVHGAAETGVAPGDSPAAVPGPDRAVATEFAARETVPGLTGAGPLLLATGVAPAEAAVAATESAPQSPPEADAARGAEPATPAADPRAAWTAGQKAELVELVAGKSARETEKLLAELEPDLGLPRERERALGGGRYEVRVILDQTSVESIAKLKDWLSHVNPGFSTGQLLAYLLQQAERKHDPIRERGRAGRRSVATAGKGKSQEQRSGVTGGAVAAGSPQNRGIAMRTRRRSPVQTHLHLVAAVSDAAWKGGSAQGSLGSPVRGVSAATAIPRWREVSTLELELAPARRRQHGGGTAGSAQNQRAPLAHGRSGGQARRGSTGSAQNQRAPLGADRSHEQPRPDTAGSAQNRGVLLAGNNLSRSEAPRESTGEGRRRMHIPAAVRRAVWRRYGAACCYRDSHTGVTCGSTHLLQIDHIVPWALGGSDEIANLRPYCAVHNRQRDPRCAGYGSAAGRYAACDDEQPGAPLPGSPAGPFTARAHPGSRRRRL